MPEPDSDKFRTSPELCVGLEKPVPYPRHEYVYMVEDEAYGFRTPDTAYMDGGANGQLPDGLQSEGQFPRHFGEKPVRNEGNGPQPIRHNVAAGQPHVPQLPDRPGTDLKIKTTQRIRKEY